MAEAPSLDIPNDLLQDVFLYRDEQDRLNKKPQHKVIRQVDEDSESSSSSDSDSVDSDFEFANELRGGQKRMHNQISRPASLEDDQAAANGLTQLWEE